MKHLFSKTAIIILLAGLVCAQDALAQGSTIKRRNTNSGNTTTVNTGGGGNKKKAEKKKIRFEFFGDDILEIKEEDYVDGYLLINKDTWNELKSMEDIVWH